MKTLQLLIMVLFGASLFTSCLKDQCTETRTFIRYDPVYRTQAQLEEPITVEAPRPLEHPGIIYFYQNYILINEYQAGIHVINNTDQKNPVNEAFIAIDGNEHFAVIHDQLQASKFNDLLTIDIADLQHPVEKSRIRNVFQEAWEDPTRGFLVGHRQTEQTMTLDCSDPNFNSLRWSSGNTGGFWLDVAFANSLEFLPAGAAIRDQTDGSAQGIGGSTARFTIASGHLYIVSDFDLKVLDLKDPASPVLRNTINLGWGIETIYPFKDRLFIGSSAGMHVFDISNPEAPLFQAMFEHARACDPVVADDNTAYVTLHDGTECEGFANQLDVIAVDNILNPRLINTYAMKHPHGLTLAGDILYVCEGQFGLKILDVSDRDHVEEIDFHKDIPSKDVIALPNETLLVIGDEGFSQYKISDPRKIEFLSRIPVVKS
ncbi:MAG: hypothetical protein KDC80_08780 [Saprospiraceae bacterium]|nr:hypothetical protein [Saprospiraceae bacterium]